LAKEKKMANKASRFSNAAKLGLAGLAVPLASDSTNFPKRVQGSSELISSPIESHWQPIAQDEFARTDDEVRDAFIEQLEQWRSATKMSSNQVRILMHPAHYKIIGLGPQVLPYIFEDLANGGGPWFLALESITHENPIPDDHRKSAKLMRADWVNWGKDHGYLSA
jgi:hypothetical protein